MAVRRVIDPATNEPHDASGPDVRGLQHRASGHAHRAAPGPELVLWPLSPPTDDDVQAVAMRVVKAVLKLVADAMPDDAGDDDERAVDAALIEAAQSPLSRAEPVRAGLPKRRTAQIQTELGMCRC